MQEEEKTFSRKIQTYITGSTRSAFDDELEKTGQSSSELAREIITYHYKRKEEIQNQLKIADIQKHSKSKYM